MKNYKNGAWPNGLALDFLSKRIYWIDARANSIHSANYDGSDHREILRNVESLGHPFSIDIFESHVYWTDWRSQTIGKHELFKKFVKFISRKKFNFISRADRIFPLKIGPVYETYLLFFRMFLSSRKSNISLKFSVNWIQSNIALQYIFKKQPVLDRLLPRLINLLFPYIEQANKFNGSDIRVLDQILSQPCDLVIVHPSKQPKIKNPNDLRLSCSKLNCSQLCLLSNSKDGPKCACSHLWRLEPDQRTCVPYEKFILFSRGNILISRKNTNILIFLWNILISRFSPYFSR